MRWARCRKPNCEPNTPRRSLDSHALPQTRNDGPAEPRSSINEIQSEPPQIAAGLEVNSDKNRRQHSFRMLPSRFAPPAAYFIACGLMGDPVPPVMMSGGPEKK